MAAFFTLMLLKLFLTKTGVSVFHPLSEPELNWLFLSSFAIVPLRCVYINGHHYGISMAHF